MALYQRARDVLAAKANKALDAAEQPDEMLDLSYEQMLDQLTKARQALVTIAASRKRIELQEQQPGHSGPPLQEQATPALPQGRPHPPPQPLPPKPPPPPHLPPPPPHPHHLP